uniref:Putative reverse transcriptase and intron maturase n=2 Tax=Ignatiaceae TaxID=2682551 RepID=A0A1W6EGV6_9CHLO|nr:putative reverse transcriptase and intron maturase [Pseudocharacium americanum]YP_009367704.1 putative reverse transcriptase and intron maturase [Ignatius tetrasporus]ARK14626.1 putative reverse transcriptase and intron maturase [Pseudocharacium americanum]ARK14720.1 putative reverse transcriptase and intron maturase [Ignatius tetrasporus]
MILLKSLIQPIYHSSKEDTWTGVYWSKVEKTVENLQQRITKAAERGNYRKVRNLQRLLTKRSLSASLKAVRIVAKKNSWKKKPGIDKQLWTTPELKLQAALELRNKLDVKPLKNFYIPSTNGSPWQVGLLSISNGAHQALWNMALLPCVEATSDPQSYGFRPDRSCWDANAQIRTLLNKQNSPQWVLNANIEKSFAKINHYWLVNHTPMKTNVLKSWLKKEYVEKKNTGLFFMEKNTTQGDVFSPTLANHTLNGLEECAKKIELCSIPQIERSEIPQIALWDRASLDPTAQRRTIPPNSSKHLKNKFKHGYAKRRPKGNQTKKETCINVVRYANDLIVTGRSQRQLERVKKSIKEFLAPRGLRINEEKTSILHISQGFEFLGWTFRKYSNGKFLCKISNQSILKHRNEIKNLIQTIHQPEILTTKLNHKIRSWMNYHRCANNIWNVWSSMNQYLYERLMKWGLRRHGKKTLKWVLNKYWKNINGCWTFTGTNQYKNNYKLVKYDLPKKKILARRLCEAQSPRHSNG